MTMKKQLHLGLALAAMAAAVGGRFMQGARTLRSMGLADPFAVGAVPTSRNGGRSALGNRHVQRMARKRRNQARHRKACR